MAGQPVTSARLSGAGDNVAIGAVACAEVGSQRDPSDRAVYESTEHVPQRGRASAADTPILLS